MISIVNDSATLTMLYYSVIHYFEIPPYSFLADFFFLFLYFSLFYLVWAIFLKRYKRVQKEQHLQQLFNQILSISHGNKELVTTNEPAFNDVAQAVNTIVQNANQAMNDERQMEQTKNELITNVSHDIRTPLTSIIGYLSIIEEDKYRDEVELRRYTQIVYEKAFQMDRLIHELFEYTRMQDRHYIIKRDSVNLQEMVSQILVHHAILIDSSGMIVREKHKTTDAIIQGDGETLARMFDNLLINAIKHGNEGIYIDLSIESNETSVSISITNYGKPIRSTDLPYLFDRFYQADKSRTNSDKGSGLGLAIVKSIVDLHGGTIDISSTYEGTTVTVRFTK